MVEYQRVVEIAQFGGELSLETKKLLDLGKKLEILFTQDKKTIIPRGIQLFLFGLLLCGFWENKQENIMKAEIDRIVKDNQEVFLLIEKEIEKLKNLEELKYFTKEMIPVVKEVLYQPLL